MAARTAVLFSYDTEFPVATEAELPPDVISPEKYKQLSLQEKQELWVAYQKGRDLESPLYRDLSWRELEMVKRLGELFTSYGGSMTSFVLGEWLDWVVDAFGPEFVCDRLLAPGIEIGSHSYHHLAYQTAGGVRDQLNATLTDQSVWNEVRDANAAIEKHLGVHPRGLRTPMGNLQPFGEEHYAILEALADNGIVYVSSWLKKAQKEPNAPADTQPFTYEHLGFPGLWEIPAVGKYDVHFTQPTKLLIFDDASPGDPEALAEHYISVLDAAARHANATSTTVFVPFVLHPWATAAFDPNLRAHRRILDYCKSTGIEIMSYGQAYDLLAA